MLIYLAGLYTSNFHKEGQLYARLTDAERSARDGVQNYLESYHYIHKQAYVEKLRADKVKVFLDSGAFSSFTKGVKVDLPGYCAYIKKNRDIILEDDGVLVASVLDGIGDAKLTGENQQAMERLGVRPLPCFHYGEDERYLEWYISNYSYITLGGMVPISTPQLYHWLDRIWDKYLTDGSGRPRLKVHGFGLTTVPLMQRYPWYSVDSSSWVQIAANGNIYLPDYGMVPVSLSSPAAKDANRHLDTFRENDREVVKHIISTSGFELQRLQVEYVSRWSWNCKAFTDLNKMMATPGKTFKDEQIRLF